MSDVRPPIPDPRPPNAGCDRAGCIGGYGCCTFAVSAFLIFAIILGNFEHLLSAESSPALLIIPFGAILITLINVKLFVWLWDRACEQQAEENARRDME